MEGPCGPITCNAVAARWPSKAFFLQIRPTTAANDPQTSCTNCSRPPWPPWSAARQLRRSRLQHLSSVPREQIAASGRWTQPAGGPTGGFATRLRSTVCRPQRSYLAIRVGPPTDFPASRGGGPEPRRRTGRQMRTRRRAPADVPSPNISPRRLRVLAEVSTSVASPATPLRVANPLSICLTNFVMVGVHPDRLRRPSRMESLAPPPARTRGLTWLRRRW